MTKKFKDILKINPEPAKGKFGVDPMDPWSTKANISEDGSLGKFLMSRGINPKFISTDTKISHAKSSAFLKWKQDHQFESVEHLDEDALLDKFLMSRGINPKYATKEMKISHSKSGQFIKWKHDHMFEEIQNEEVDKADTLTFDIPLMIRMLELAREDVKDDMELHRITERLISIRSKGTLTMDDYDFIADIKKLKEEIEALAEGKMKSAEIDKAETQRLNKMTTLQKFRADSGARAKKHDAIEKNSGGMTSAIDRLQKHMNKEEVNVVEAISKKDLLNKLTKDLNSDEFKNAPRDPNYKGWTGPKPGDQNYTKNFGHGYPDTPSNRRHDRYVNKSLKKETNEEIVTEMDKSQDAPGRDTDHKLGGKEYTGKPVKFKKFHTGVLKSLNKAFNKPTSEDTLDPLAATQSPNDCGTSPNDVSPKKQAMSKSARMIKSLYKHHNMKEDMTDWEKEDKSVQTYGKKPKIMEPDEKKNLGEKKPDARIVMSGGTTLSGEKRDTVEIDPLMKNRPGPDTFGATGKKASQQ